MECVQQAVLAFDEEVRAPWRPRLVSVPALAEPAPHPSVALEPRRSAPAPGRPSGRRAPSRVGACRPPNSALHSPRGAGRVASDRRVASRPARSRVRLTRRARRLVFLLAVLGALVLGSLVGSVVSGDGGEALDLAGGTSVVVAPGDTLWSIAESVAADDDVRVVVDRIQELNGLQGSGLVPGQILQLP